MIEVGADVDPERGLEHDYEDYGHKETKRPLYITAQEGHEEVVRLLIKADADLNTKKYYNEGSTTRNLGTPLHVAAQDGHEAVVRALVELGANLHKARNRGATPLYSAAHNSHAAIVQILKDAGAAL